MCRLSRCSYLVVWIAAAGRLTAALNPKLSTSTGTKYRTIDHHDKDRTAFNQNCTSTRPSTAAIFPIASSSKHVWLFWNTGRAGLATLAAAQPTGKYSVDHLCVRAWQTTPMNPGWQVHVLDDETAKGFAPRWAALMATDTDGRLLPSHSSDVLRLELLSRYGGVWADTSVFPQRPLEEWLPLYFSHAGGFYAPPANYQTGGAGELRPGFAGGQPAAALQPYAQCHLSPGDDASDARSVSSFFLAASAPHNPVVGAWFDDTLLKFAEVLALKSCPQPSPIRNSSIAAAKTLCFPYFLLHCSFTQLRYRNSAVEASYAGLVSVRRACCQARCPWNLGFQTSGSHYNFTFVKRPLGELRAALLEGTLTTAHVPPLALPQKLPPTAHLRRAAGSPKGWFSSQ
jgi:hypothetical protein